MPTVLGLPIGGPLGRDRKSGSEVSAKNFYTEILHTHTHTHSETLTHTHKSESNWYVGSMSCFLCPPSIRVQIERLLKRHRTWGVCCHSQRPT